MVTINIYGLDGYNVSKYSQLHTKEIANLCETSEDNVNFIVSENSIIHNGVEQNSWNVIVFVYLPNELKQIEKLLANYLLETLGEISIHVHIQFEYFDQKNRYSRINKKYPLFIKDIDKARKEVDDEDLFEEHQEDEDEYDDYPKDDGCGCGHHHHHEEEDSDDEDEEENAEEVDIFMGNAFDNID